MERYEDAAWRDSMKIRFDFNNVMAEAVGEQGITSAEIDALSDEIARGHEAIIDKRQRGILAWMDLPYQNVDDILAYAAEWRDKVDNFVVLGIGGSALGAIAVQTALNHPYYNLMAGTGGTGGVRLFVLDNVDPDFINAALDTIDVEKTLFNVISKSGSTAETMSQFIIFRHKLLDKLGSDYAAHVVATTDAKAGNLRLISEAEGYRTFVVPNGVGGRFSVLCPVGLLPAAMVGIDIRELLAGAAYADEICRNPTVWENPAYVNATLQFLAYGKGKHISIMMPYAQCLRDLADWYRQLWAESLGKRVNERQQVVNVGPTPVKALGATDQHSQVQLYVEGPYDKVVNFLVVDRYHTDVIFPHAFEDIAGISYLGGHTMSELIQAEQAATAIALTAAQRMNCTHTLPEVNAFTLGQLLYMLEVQTAISGELYGINAFDQPGVEAGKIATYALLGRDGYAERKAEIEEQMRKKRARYVIA